MIPWWVPDAMRMAVLHNFEQVPIPADHLDHQGLIRRESCPLDHPLLYHFGHHRTITGSALRGVTLCGSRHDETPTSRTRDKTPTRRPLKHKRAHASGPWIKFTMLAFMTIVSPAYSDVNVTAVFGAGAAGPSATPLKKKKKSSARHARRKRSSIKNCGFLQPPD
jgi:hypothetical protein